MTETIIETSNMKQVIKDRIEKIEQGIVPEGYKETEVGIIPSDWKCKKLSDISEIVSGGTPRTNVEEYWDGDIMWATPTDITKSSKIIKSTERRITEKGLKNSSAKLLPVNSILMTSRATIGERSINKVPMATNQGFKSLVPKEGTDVEFLYYLIDIFKRSLQRLGNGSTFLEVSTRDVKALKINYPPFIEQQKIADILSTWDRAIELKESLIEEKEERKKGLMKTLLSPKEGWEFFQLGNVLKNKSETGYPNLELIAVTMRDGVIRRDELDRKDTSSANKDNYKLVEPNDIVYNTMRMWQGVSGLSNYRGIVSPAYTVLEPKTSKVDSLFISYLFKLRSIVNIFRRYSQGLVKDTLNLNYSNFSQINIKLPSLSKQKSIAKILSSADKEIGLLKQEVELLKEQKKGLMQLLLTGIVRVGEVGDVE